MNERMYLEIKGILNDVSGDIIDFRVYKGATFSYLVKLAAEYNRLAVGMDTFYGLESPTKPDWNEHNQLAYPKGYAKSNIEIVHNTIQKVCSNNTPYELYSGNLTEILSNLKPRQYAISIIDLFQYSPTKKAIEYIYNKMTSGGSIYFLNYNKHSQHQSSKAVNEFLKEFENHISICPEIYFNDNRLNVCRIICTPPIVKKLDIPIIEAPSPFKRVINSSLSETELTIALVLKTGGDTYNYKYVNTLAKNIRKHVNLNFKLTVLTDNDNGIDPYLVDEVIPLKHNYKGWWSKIELFRPDIFTTDRVFYLDLDTVIVNNIDEMLSYNTTFSGIRDLYHHNFFQTGILSWNSKYNHQIYNDFSANASNIMSNYVEGDAKWIRENVYNYDYLCDQFPGRIVSYKAHCLNRNTGVMSIPKDSSIICFHGKPRPHTISHPDITKHWVYK